MKKVIYIAGPITGVPRYWEAFETAEDELTAAGGICRSARRACRTAWRTRRPCGSVWR